MNKIKVYHFHNGKGGGVLSVIRNLLQYSNNPLIENHVIYTINKEQTPVFTIEHIKGAVTEQIFYYSPKWNFYYTCRQLAKLLPDDKALVVAHDWLELGMMSNLGLQNPVVHVLHGDFDYYYELTAKHNHVVDAYICISAKIFHTLKEKLPSRQNDIFYLNFPVPSIEAIRQTSELLYLIYYVRDLKEHRKQFSTIIEIAECLSASATDYWFTIAGGGMTSEEFFEHWPAKMKHQVNFIGLKTNEEVIAILPSQDIFLLPSLSEGLPVSLVEAMKAGVVPLVTNWEGAVDELVTPGVTGYYLKISAAADYAACIRKFKTERLLLKQLSENCVRRANTLFDPENNTKKFESVFIKIARTKVWKKIPIKVYGSRLDINGIPNWMVNTIRIINKL